ncbi:MAG: hypothetical protein RL030_1819 [Pseudomonadota bacterium]|jgi:hypothetical protein
MKRIFLAAFSTCAAMLTFFIGVALPLRAVAQIHEAPAAINMPNTLM